MAEIIDALELIGPTAFGSSEEYGRFLEVLDALRPKVPATADTEQNYSYSASQ